MGPNTHWRTPEGLTPSLHKGRNEAQREHVLSPCRHSGKGQNTGCLRTLPSATWQDGPEHVCDPDALPVTDLGPHPQTPGTLMSRTPGNGTPLSPPEPGCARPCGLARAHSLHGFHISDFSGLKTNISHWKRITKSKTTELQGNLVGF